MGDNSECFGITMYTSTAGRWRVQTLWQRKLRWDCFIFWSESGRIFQPPSRSRSPATGQPAVPSFNNALEIPTDRNITTVWILTSSGPLA
ncbi:hypothetical protein RRG08_055321 [Elysia crispata]|uniref:Uncharacterized protein n=1 Tax=Elysia crispata TaxID=231223 RepID=A0AAE1AQF9_9GAST|nr:hypothetical protein RRG08_055321 [Elysia crispata]